MVPYRTGNNAGEPIPASIQQTDDPNDYVILTDTDVVSNGNETRDGYQSLAGSNNDPNLATIYLSATYGGQSAWWNLYEPGQSDPARIVLSDPTAVRLFNGVTDQLFYDSQQTGAAPLSNLTSLALNENYNFSAYAPIVLEGLHSDPNFVMTFEYLSPSGQVIASDSVHMDIVAMNLVGTDGSSLPSAELNNNNSLELTNPLTDIATPVWKNALVAAANDSSAEPITAGDTGNDSFFQVQLQGLSSDSDAQLQVTSDSVSSDSFNEPLVYDGTDASEQDFNVLYNGDAYGSTDDTPLTSEQQSEIQSNLDLYAVHNPGATVTLNFPDDTLTQKVAIPPTVSFTANNDLFSQGGTITGSATIPGDAADSAHLTIDIVLNNQIVFTQNPNTALTTQSFQYTFQTPGLYEVVAGIAGSENSYSAFAVDVDNVVAASPWAQEAWDALRVSGAAGSVPAGAFARNRIITRLYGNMYNQNVIAATGDDYLFWTGMAAYTSATAGDAIADASLGIEVNDFTGALSFLPNLQQLYNLLGQGNLAIFLNVYPALLAYTASGIQAVDAMSQQNPALTFLDNAMQGLDAAVQANPVNQAGLWTAVTQIAIYEQSKVLQPLIFDPNMAYWTNFSNSVLGSSIASLIPNTQTFLQVVPAGNFGVAANRLAYFSLNLLPAFQALVAANPGQPINIDALLQA